MIYILGVSLAIYKLIIIGLMIDNARLRKKLKIKNET